MLGCFWFSLRFCSDAEAMSDDRTPKLTAVPAKRSNAAVLKVRLFLILGLGILVVLTGAASTLAWITNKPPVIDFTASEAKARGSAEEVATAWLNGRQIPVGLAANITGTKLSGGGSSEDAAKKLDYTSISWDSFTNDTLGDGTTIELHRFIVVAPPLPSDTGDVTPVTYALTVTMVLTNGEPVLGAAPSLEAYVPAGSSYLFDYSTLADRVEVSSQVSGIVDQWATAFATNDSAQLGLIVADPAKGVYDGIAGFTAGKPTIVYALSNGGDNLIVRARVSLVSANGFNTEAEYDLYVTQASSGSPHIVAWGPAGAGNRPDFVPYEFNRRPL